MWTKIFRSKSSKCKSRDDVNKIKSARIHVCPPPDENSGPKFTFTKVVHSLTLKRHRRDGKVTRVNVEDFTPIDYSFDFYQKEKQTESDYSSIEPESLEAIAVETDIVLEPCPICTRTFAPKTLKKHVVICEKAAVKKRKQFDSSRQRREGTDLADFLPRNYGLPQNKPEAKSSPTEKVAKQTLTPVLQRKEPEYVKTATLPLRKTISPVANVSAAPPAKEKPKPVLSRLAPTAEPCPHCARSFGPKAYDRHVEWCKEKTRLANAQQRASINVAKERLQARTKYKAPCLKTKRAVNREKYSGLSCEESTHSLSDGGSTGSALKELSTDNRGNLEISMTSSLMSTSLMSDGYDEPIENNTSRSVQKRRISESRRVKEHQESNTFDFLLEGSECFASANTKPQANLIETPKTPSIMNQNQRAKVSKIPKKSSQISLKNDRDEKKDEVDMQEENSDVQSTYSLKHSSSRLSSVYLTEDEQDFSQDQINQKTSKNEVEETDCRDAAAKSYPENNIATTPIQNNNDNLIGDQKLKTRQSLKEFIQQRKIDMNKKSESDSIEIILPKITSVSNIELNGSYESVRSINHRTSFSDISCNDLTFSCEDDVVSDYEDLRITGTRPEVLTSPSKSYTIRGLSDKYDPFLSAKRQLEELCSPTGSVAPTTSLPATPNIKTTPDSLMSKSYISNPTTKLSNVKSNFHRTSSLRMPRKTTPNRTIFPAAVKQKPTIQRGISDEGPISNSFIKPEEYDEMPVRSVCINDFATGRHSDNQSTPKIIKREPTANRNRNRRNLKVNLASIDQKDINPLSKTDSLAIFLHYENATRISQPPVNLTEKDLKDKSNNLSKQTSSKSSASDLDNILTDKEKLSSLKNSLSCLLDPANSGIDNPHIQNTNPKSLPKLQAIKLEPLPKLFPKSDASHFRSFPTSSKDNDFIDPKLINVCDNLPINVTKLSDNDLTSSSSDSMEKTALQSESKFVLPVEPEENSLNQPVVLRNSAERKNLLKRQLRLGKNHFLYDLSPENDNFRIETDTNIFSPELDSNKLDSSASTVDPVPDEFDIEEFISSFENAEDYPLFKDYKAFLSTRSLNKTSNNSRESSRSPTGLSRTRNGEDDDNGEEKNEIFSSNESFLKHESEAVPFTASCTAERDPPKRSLNLNDLNPSQYNRPIATRFDDDEEDAAAAADDSMANENVNMEKSGDHTSFDHMDSSNDVTDNLKDLSKPSSLESLEIKKSVSSKQSADSAYGSLSRHSPVERTSRRTSALRSTIPDTSNESQSKRRNIHDLLETKRRSRDLSNDSTSSGASSHNLFEKNHHQRIAEASVKKECRMSKFCHECGSKFILAQAKFCMECGVKRMILE